MDKTKKFYTLYANNCNLVDTYEEAEKMAKREAAGSDCCGGRNGDVYIMEAVAVASSPVPDVEVTKF